LTIAILEVPAVTLLIPVVVLEVAGVADDVLVRGELVWLIDFVPKVLVPVDGPPRRSLSESFTESLIRVASSVLVVTVFVLADFTGPDFRTPA